MKQPEMASFFFWKNSVLFLLFFSITPFVIGISLFSLIALSTNYNSSDNNDLSFNLVKYPKPGLKVYASLPARSPSVWGAATAQDARIELIKQYLVSFNSPLSNYAHVIVDKADQNKIDFRLTTAIAMQESNLCKKIPLNSYNCWGWGIHSNGTLEFSSFEEGIEAVSKGLKEKYIDKGFITIEDIMSKYTPNSNGSWAYGVNKFIYQMQ